MLGNEMACFRERENSAHNDVCPCFPCLRTLDTVARPPINICGNLSEHVPAKSPSNITPTPSKVICKVSESYLNSFW